MGATEADASPRYSIKREWRSSVRLNLQHFVFRDAVGGLLHPSIPANHPSQQSKPMIHANQPSLRIADVGAGSAIWTLQMAAANPAAHVDAIDISDEQFATGFDMRNVGFYTHDCLQPFPYEYGGQYDIVNVRAWLCVVNTPQAIRLLQNLVSLLKPGGYLQWLEMDPHTLEVWKPRPDMPTPFMDTHVRLSKKPREDSDFEWVKIMPNLFRENGLEDVVGTYHDLDDSARKIWIQNILLAMEDYLKPDPDDHEVDKFIKQQSLGMQHEINDGVATRLKFKCVVGRKSA